LGRVILATADITAQKEAERIVRQSQEKIEDLINSIDGIVWECDTSETFKLLYMSRKVKEILGYTPEEWAADDHFWEKHIHPDDKEMCTTVLNTVAREKKRMDFEYRMMHKDGSVVWIQDFMNVNYNDDRPMTIRGIMIDVTRTKQVEQALNASLDLVTEQKKRLMNFSYIVSHNLRSHAANIKSIVGFIETADTDQEREEMVAMLRTVSNALNETMENLNDLVNIQTNVALHIEPIYPRQYVVQTVKALSEQIESKSVTVHNNIPDDAVLSYNPAYFDSIVLNFISNGIRYAHPGRIPVISVDWAQENGKKRLTVSDNGVGIDLEKYGDKLFGMYKTFHGNADAKGIGLFMTKSQIEAMGGTVSVESEPGKGTAFTVTFN
jgi:PAS domain S-box-containing protein